MKRNNFVLVLVVAQFFVGPRLFADDGRHLSVEDFADYSLTSLSNKVREIEDNNSRLSLENDVLRQKITDVSQELSSFSKDNGDDPESQVNQDKEKERFLLESKFERLQKDLEGTKQFNQSLQEKLDAQQKQEQVLIQQVNELKLTQNAVSHSLPKKENNKGLNQSKDKLRGLIKDQKNILSAKDKELALLTQKLVRPKADLNTMKTSSNLLKQKISLLNDEMTILKNDESKLTSNLDLITKHSENELDVLDAGRDELKQELIQLEDTLAKVKKKLGNRTLSADEKDPEIKDLNESLATITKEKENLQKEVADLETKLTQLQIAK